MGNGVVTPTTDASDLAVAAMDTYGAQLHRFLRRRLRNATDLDDVAQEVYLRLLRVKNASTVRNPLAYIFGVASHVASEFNLRDGKRPVVFDSTTAEATMEMEGASPERQRAETGGYLERRINEALNELSDKRLAVLLLERREGLTHVQIAEKLGLSVHTVKKYSVQALAHVRMCLK